MNDFERMMLREGVKPLNTGQPRTPVIKNKNGETGLETKVPVSSPAAYNGETMKPMSKPKADKNGLPYWAKGKEAKEAFANALAMFNKEHSERKQGFITAIRHDGKATWINGRLSPDEILARSDRESIRIIVIGGAGWTCILHPGMGIATIEMDPPDEK